MAEQVSQVRTFRAPGRVNLIGEHTDYNLGYVLPIALNLATYVEVHRRDDGRLHLLSDHKPEELSWDLSELTTAQPRKHWSDYVIGVAQQLLQRGYAIPSCLLKIRSDVPEGSGLSSSAALEVSSALSLLGGRAIDKVELAKLCRAAENDFVGMPCGIMDQYVSVFGERGAAIQIDCRVLEHRAVELPEGVAVVVVNSRVKHELGNSAYRERVSECALAVESVKHWHPEVESLRDVTLEHLAEIPMPELVRRRARHIVTDTLRVELFVDAAARGNLREMGLLFVDSHRSMQHDYEITCAEVDFLAETAMEIPGCIGARMTGGGFGGCTVNLVAPEYVDSFTREIVRRYQERWGIAASVFVVEAAAGAGEVRNLEPHGADSLAG